MTVFYTTLMIKATNNPVITLLCLFSIVATSIVLFKVWQFFIEYRLFNRNVDSLVDECLLDPKPPKNEPRPHPRLSTLQYAINAITQRDLSFQIAKEDSFRFAKKHLDILNSQLKVLEIIANLSPLLGLFGTVLGMIAAFKAMELAGAQVDPSVLSAGIWQALLTTAVGLGVAIPTSLIHAWLERQTEVLAQELQDDLERCFTTYSRLAAQHTNVSVAA